MQCNDCMAAERKTSDLDSSIEAVQEEIKELQTERAALLAKLEQVELSLAKAHARKVRGIADCTSMSSCTPAIQTSSSIIPMLTPDP